ncbi:MAG: 30S ribosomal protein S3 [Magnetococcales bacterium]|nr:30S ribosomal protein S3 [Magnetococcales bacterium]
MGQKVHPTGFRLGITKSWNTKWYSDKGYADLLLEDIQLREWLNKRLAHASVSKIVIERPAQRARINIHSARPGIIIGKKGADIEKLKQDLQRVSSSEVQINIVEVRKPESDAQLVANSVAQQLVRRVAFRRAMKRSVTSAIRLGAEGIRINCAGRLGGSEIARTEWYREGRVPLHTLRADIDYGLAEARTTYGIIGVKVWVFKGEIIEKK